MDWRIQRQIIIFSTYFLIFFLPFSFFTYQILKKSPSCFDGIQNAKEEGVDCNGSCQLRCDGTYRDVRINYVRSMPVMEGVYDVFALLENYNTEINFPNVPYEIKMYNTDGKLIGTASGSVALLPQTKAAIYLPRLELAQAPKTIDLSLQPHKALNFLNAGDIPRNISVENWQAQRGANNSLQVVGEIKNPNNQEVRNIDVYALLYDDTKTVYAVSKTKVFSLKGREKTAVAFTWGDVISPTNVDFVVVLEQ
jgi:hypothetical protein